MYNWALVWCSNRINSSGVWAKEQWHKNVCYMLSLIRFTDAAFLKPKHLRLWLLMQTLQLRKAFIQSCHLLPKWLSVHCQTRTLIVVLFRGFSYVQEKLHSYTNTNNDIHTYSDL